MKVLECGTHRKKIGTGFGIARNRVSKLFSPREYRQLSSSSESAFVPVTDGTAPVEETGATHSVPGDAAIQQATTTGSQQPGGQEQKNDR